MCLHVSAHVDFEIYKICKNSILIFANYTNQLMLAYFKILEVFINNETIIIANIIKYLLISDLSHVLFHLISLPTYVRKREILFLPQYIDDKTGTWRL